jgi:putative transposase
VVANPFKGNAMPQSYETSLSDAAWEVIEAIFPAKSTAGRPRVYSIRSIVDAVLYIVKNGCVWRCLPNDFPPWPTVYYYFKIWSIAGLWEILNSTLVVITRRHAGKEDTPSLVSLDSQSQTAEPGVEERLGWRKES